MAKTSSSKFLLWLLSFVFFNYTMLISTSIAYKITGPELGDFVNTETAFFDENGEKKFIDQYEGKTILLVFWATWCGSCVNEMPALDNLQKDFRKLPFEVIALSQDYKGVSAVTKYYKDYELRHLKPFHDKQNQLFREFQIASLPTAYIIGPDGKLKQVIKGIVKWHSPEVREMILKYIPGEHETPKNTFKIESLNKKVLHSAPSKLYEEKQQEAQEQQENQDTSEESEKTPEESAPENSKPENEINQKTESNKTSDEEKIDKENKKGEKE